MKCYLSLLALGLSLVCTSKVSAQLPPDKELKSFKLSNGLDMSLWASEINPLDPAAKEAFMVNPTCMDIDHKGRVWVCESVNYRKNCATKKRCTGPRAIASSSSKTPRARQGGQSHRLLPVARDSRAARHRRVPDTDGPGYKVFVCQSPDILVFEDKDGDGKADGPPKKLLTGFSGFDHDHGVHGILIGPDKKLYFTVGDQGVKDLQSSDGKGRSSTPTTPIARPAPSGAATSTARTSN